MRPFSNILAICFIGPMRNMVLQSSWIQRMLKRTEGQDEPGSADLQAYLAMALKFPRV